VWREKPKEIVDEWDASSLFGALCSLAGVFLLKDDLPSEWRINVTTGPLAAAIGSVVVYTLYLRSDLDSKFIRRHAQGLPLAKANGPKHLVSVSIRHANRNGAQDSGILIFERGCLRYQGFQTEFSIPREFATRSEGGDSEIDVLVGTKKVKLIFSEKGLWDGKESLASALDKFWTQSSSGEFIPPPTSTPASPEYARRVLIQFALWTAAIVMAHFQGQNLARQGLVEAHAALVSSFGLAALCTAILPVFRMARLAWSLRKDPPISASPTLSLPEESLRTDSEVEAATVSNTR
jgi:hypothetical protein